MVLCRLLDLMMAAPGTVIHEMAHQLFCRLIGVRVHRVVYFRLGSPAGYVIHGAPRHFRGQLAITSGPLVLNSLLAYAAFVLAASRVAMLTGVLASSLASSPGVGGFMAFLSACSGDVAVTVLCLWLGLSIALHAFPSSGDARALWLATGTQLRRGNLLAIVGYPLALLIRLVNLLTLVRLHWAYSVSLLWLAFITAPNLGAPIN